MSCQYQDCDGLIKALIQHSAKLDEQLEKLENISCKSCQECEEETQRHKRMSENLCSEVQMLKKELREVLDSHQDCIQRSAYVGEYKRLSEIITHLEETVGILLSKRIK